MISGLVVQNSAKINKKAQNPAKTLKTNR